ncbi:MAG: helix-hairpin-helix domain-containing protein [Anaerolineae bacterium]|nr:helix-hairpin-helix domain-containing protein [Anaerolineae bacterium]
MTAYVWQGKIYSDPYHGPNEMRESLRERGLFPGEKPVAAPNTDINPQMPPVTADDLTAIDNLGAKSAAALNELGIHTFADLANADLDVLSTIDGVSRNKAIAWVAEAETLLEDSE